MLIQQLTYRCDQCWSTVTISTATSAAPSAIQAAPLPGKVVAPGAVAFAAVGDVSPTSCPVCGK